VSLLTLFSGLGADLGLTTIVLAHVVFTVSYVAVVVKARLAGLDRTLEEAATDLGAGPIGAFARVTLPRLVPGIVAAALLVFTLSLDDYVVTSLVGGVDSQTLPVQVYSMLRVAVTPEVNAACTVLLAVTVSARGGRPAAADARLTGRRPRPRLRPPAPCRPHAKNHP
jgi:spermidine/putrescine transport system permease protein